MATFAHSAFFLPTRFVPNLDGRCRQFLTGSAAFVKLEADPRRRLGRRPRSRKFLCQLLICTCVNDAVLDHSFIFFFEAKGSVPG